MARIFISYRRSDSEGYAGRIWDRLILQFGPDSVFMDVDSIDPGASFPSVLAKALGDSYVLIAVVGGKWLGSQSDGTSRLHTTNDFVRQEIQGALDRNIKVIPLLIGGAKMPDVLDLPAELTTFTHFNALEIRHSKFDTDMAALIHALESELREYQSRLRSDSSEESEVHPPSLETRKFLRQRLGEPKGIGRLIFGRW